MTAQEASAYLKLPITTLYEMAVKGKLRGVKCGRQWRFMESNVLNYLRGIHSTSEKRNHPRIKTEIQAVLTGGLSVTRHIHNQGTIQNLSEDGVCFAACDPFFDPGDPVKIVFVLENDEASAVRMEMEGRIVHCRSDRSQGTRIRFRNVSPSGRERIRSYVG